MKNFSANIFLKIIALFAGTTFLFSCNTATNALPKKETWFRDDSTWMGENYKYDDVDSLVEKQYFDKARTKKEMFALTKEINDTSVYVVEIDYDSLGRKTNDYNSDSKTGYWIARNYDELGNKTNQSIHFYTKATGNAVFKIDYYDNKIASIFYSGLPNFQKQEYDSAGKICELFLPYIDSENKKDSTIVISFPDEPEKTNFHDALMEQVEKLQEELKFPVELERNK